MVVIYVASVQGSDGGILMSQSLVNNKTRAIARDASRPRLSLSFSLFVLLLFLQ